MKYILVLTLFFSPFAFSHEVVEVALPTGSGKAVEAFDHEQGFKLSAKAIESLGVSFSGIKGKGPWKLPIESIVWVKQSQAVYRRYDDWISMVLVKIISQDKISVVVSSEDLESGDEVAIAGVHFLRLTDSDLNAGTVDTCAH